MKNNKPYENKEGDFKLFRNQKTNDRQPDYTGYIFWGGEKLRVSAWKKDGRNGSYLSGVVSRPINDEP